MSRELKRVLVINDASNIAELVAQIRRPLDVYAKDDLVAVNELLGGAYPRIDLILLDASGGADAQSILSELKQGKETRLIPVAVFVECETETTSFYDLHANSVIEKTRPEEFGAIIKVVLDFWLSPHICTPTRLER